MGFLNYFDFLFESRSPYLYKLVQEEMYVDVYEFTTDFGLVYDVRLITDNNILFVSFSVKGENQNVVTNKGDAYRVFSTVIEIIKKKFKTEKDLDTIGYDPVSSFPGDERREKIYEIGIKKNFNVIHVETKRSGQFVNKLIKIR
jgi:hypothetical protein